MNNEFTKITQDNITRYILESDSGTTTSGSVATVPGALGKVRKRGDNILAQEADKKTVPVSTPRNFVAKNAKTGGAGQHKDKKKAEKQGNVKHRKPFAEQGVAEGGEKYKVKSIGHDAKGDYYISPSTGKKVYKSGVKVGDHENPKTGEHKGVAEEITADDMAQSAHMQGLKHGREGSGNNMDRAKAQHGENFKHYNAGFLKGRNEKAKRLKVVGQGYNKKRPQPVAEGFNGEYDDEAGMAHTNLLTSARAVMGLLKTIDDKDNLPEWVQEKIAKAEMMLVGVWDYLQSQKEQGIDPQQDANEADERTMSRAAKGNEKYGKDGMKALAKAGREGASDKKLDTIRDKHDNYNENSDPYFESLRAQVEELAKK